MPAVGRLWPSDDDGVDNDVGVGEEDAVHSDKALYYDDGDNGDDDDDDDDDHKKEGDRVDNYDGDNNDNDKYDDKKPTDPISCGSDLFIFRLRSRHRPPSRLGKKFTNLLKSSIDIQTELVYLLIFLVFLYNSF